MRTAWDAIDAVAKAIVERDYEGARGVRGEDDALLYAYLAVARSDESWAERATDRLNAAIDTASQEGHRWLGLYGGLSGLGWTVEHVSRLLDRAFPSEPDGATTPVADGGDADLAADIDAAVLQQLRRTPVGAWLSQLDYDLISGLVGFGTYFLERLPTESAATGVALVIDHLESLAERSDRGVTWFTPPERLPEWQRQKCPAGYYNLGVAHGMPGAIHFLGEAAAAGIERERSLRLLNGAIDWLLAQRRPEGSASWFSAWLADGHSDDSRLSWCYGDLGILPVLFQAARRTGRGDVKCFADGLLDHSLSRGGHDSQVADAALCHGAAGVGHIFNRLYQTEGDARCRDAAVAWFDRTLAMRQATSAAGGFLAATQPEPGGPTIWEASPSFLAGAGGIALGLLSALTATEPAWDRLLLLSGTEHHNESFRSENS